MKEENEQLFDNKRNCQYQSVIGSQEKDQCGKRNNSINGVHVYIMKFPSAYYLGGFIKTI